MDKTIPILYNSKTECCGCGACLNACPRQAISMQEDEAGFFYPQIDESRCICCGKCKNVCAFQNKVEINFPIAVYAAISRDAEIRENSASGGVFAQLARMVLKSGGGVVGAAMQKDFRVQHILIDCEKDLAGLQGSKYTESSIGLTFQETQKILETGRNVLYSGTPCQIAGLYGFLGKDYGNLITIDLVCHGVPNNRMFQDYLACFSSKYGEAITDFRFRDKKLGWGINGSAETFDKKVKIWASASSYLFYFAKGWIYRPNCYHCKYTCCHRPADLTLGDYWGIEKQHPEYLGKGKWEESRGISLVIANTYKGAEVLKLAESYLDLKGSTFEKVAAGNAQLCHPSSPGKREEIVKLYCELGWEALEKRFQKNIGWRRYSSQIKAMLPSWLRRFIKSLK